MFERACTASVPGDLANHSIGAFEKKFAPVGRRAAKILVRLTVDWNQRALAPFSSNFAPACGCPHRRADQLHSLAVAEALKSLAGARKIAIRHAQPCTPASFRQADRRARWTGARRLRRRAIGAAMYPRLKFRYTCDEIRRDGGATMALVPPNENEVREFARAHRLELTAAEARSLAGAIAALVPALDSIDSLAPPVRDSVSRYSDRYAGERPPRSDDPLNAIVRRCRVRGASSGKLDGKRIGLKDSVCVAGIPASGGSHVLQGYTPEDDATIVERMLNAGAEIVAMLNMDDFALSGDGRTCANGPTLNPHNPEFCSGGSSSGSAAALYYDGIDITIGTDQGGSIRIPSSWSGTVGLKPTYGLVPYTGVMSIDPSLDHVGPMARSVSDVALMLDVIAGKDPLDQRQQEVPAEAYTVELGRGAAGLRIAVLREGFEQPGAQADVNAAVRRAVESLEKLGAKAEEVSVPAHRDASNMLWPVVAEGMMRLAQSGLQSTHFNGRYNPGLADFFGAHWPERSAREPLTVKMMIVAGEYLASRAHSRIYARAQNARAALTAAYDRVLANFDAIVMPSTPMKAHRQDEQSPYSMITNTAPFDLTGHPGLNVPCAMSEGLPVGLMIIGRHFDDATLLRLGYAFEQSVDWRKA